MTNKNIFIFITMEFAGHADIQKKHHVSEKHTEIFGR